MKKSKLIILFLLIISSNIVAQQKAKNVILFIGDGMGLNHIHSTSVTNGKLHFTSMPYTGLIQTSSANDFITDSAAAGTVISTGKKTNNGMIGMLPDSVKTENIAEYLKKKGLSTGIVATCSSTHATPAAFYAHQPSRKMDNEIAADFIVSDMDVCIAGGKKFFEQRTDNRNLTEELKKKNYKVVYSQQELQKVKSGKTLALLAEEHLPKVSEGRGNMLAESTEKAIELLSQNEKGFFLMVEGSQIDWASHDNDQPNMIKEVVDMDKAVKVALDFAMRDKNTLVIVTADHETGGIALSEGNLEKKEIKTIFTTDGHSASPVPIFSFGPGCENFTGMFDNTELKSRILKSIKNKR